MHFPVFKEDVKFYARYVKGVPFVNGRYTRGVPLLLTTVYKRIRDWTAGRSLPVRNFVEWPSPGCTLTYGLSSTLFTVLCFFREIVEIERVSPFMAAILSLTCLSVHLKIKMAAIKGQTRSISTISRKNGDCEQSSCHLLWDACRGSPQRLSCPFKLYPLGFSSQYEAFWTQL